MTNLELAKEQGNQSAPNVIDAAKASEVQIDVTLAQEQGNQAAPLIADSLASSELYDAIKQQGNQAMPLIVDALTQQTPSAESPMYLEAAQANSTVSMVSMLTTAPSLEYSTDGVTWQEWQHTTADGTHTFDTITLGAIGDRVYFRGDNPYGLAFLQEGAKRPNFSSFVMTGAVKGGGNVMSLLDKTMELTEVPDFGFMGLFAIMGEDVEPVLLTTPSMDTITTIGEGGCASMYEDCTFDMSSDGTTLNFEFPTPPITAGVTTYSTAYDVAQWMGNTNGF